MHYNLECLKLWNITETIKLKSAIKFLDFAIKNPIKRI